MHLDDAESELLKKWIIQKLEASSDADSDVLADYVLALAKTDDPEPVAKANCIENLKDFLVDNAESFVNDLFQAAATKSYDPNKPPPKPAAPVYHAPKRSGADQKLPNESRKRSYHDWYNDEHAGANGWAQPYSGGERPLKQARRGGRGGFEQRGGRQWQMSTQGYELPQQPPPPMPQMPNLAGMPPLDTDDPMAAMLAMQQAFFSSLQNGNSNQFRPPRAAQRCRDYDNKGFCAAGASCPYEHGNDPVVVPRFNQEYDPNNATLLNVTPSRVGHLNALHNDSGGRGGRGRGRGGSNFRGGGKRSDFSHIGPTRDNSITSIVVEQIPHDKLDEQSVRDFFSEFGQIEEVTLMAEKKLAIVKFDGHEAARAAYESPKVVFDNRFVKVYWYKPEKISMVTNRPTATKNQPEDVDIKESEQIDPVEFAKKQEEAQRKHEEAKKQREEAAKQKEDLDAKLKAMEAERKKMADLLAKKAGKAASPVPGSPSANGTEESEQTKALKAQLAKLEAEAKSLGIDPDAPTNGFSGSPTHRGRGGFRGRARGRGYYAGYRGGFAARGGPAGGAVMRLDNRPKTIAITFDDGTYEKHDEALRQFLLFTSLDSAAVMKYPDRDDAALVTFDQRYEGENFMAAATNSELLHIGKVEMSWYKPDEKPAVANESPDVKMETAEVKQEQPAEAYDAGDEDDLDRWS